MKNSDLRVVLCGSMSAWAAMTRVERELDHFGVHSLTPDFNEPPMSASFGDLISSKRAASLRHFGLIRDKRTHAILVVNVDKDGRRDYVGPNVFAEIAVAFAEGRRIFLFQDVPTNYADELDAWGVTCLHGDLRPFIECVRSQASRLSRVG